MCGARPAHSHVTYLMAPIPQPIPSLGIDFLCIGVCQKILLLVLSRGRHS